jgi:DNA-binding NarL/FixJ family response regulator
MTTPAEKSGYNSQRRMITVSIIEDDAPARKILAGWIGRAKSFRFGSGHGSAEEALGQLPQARPDIVLADINLPGMNGIECVRRLKLEMPQTQFVMLTVYEDADHIFQALAAGASGYLLKRTTRAGLLTALADVHAGGSPISSQVARKVVQWFQRTPADSVETERLSQREREVLELLAHGFAFKEVSDKLGISVTTVGTHVRRIYEKLHVHSRAQAVAAYTKSVRGDDMWNSMVNRSRAPK